MEERYSIEKIKEKFKIYRTQNSLLLIDDEYNLFCNAICFLIKEIVDRIHRDIFFVALSAEEVEPNKKICAIYLNLFSKDLENKKAIILLCPLLFDVLVDKREQYHKILHEIAHYYLEHKNYKNPEERKKLDDAADKQASRWLEEAGISWPPKN